MSIDEEKDALLAEIRKSYGATSEDTMVESTPEETAEDVSTTVADEATTVTDGASINNAPQSNVIKGNPMPRYGKGWIFIPIAILITVIGVVLGHIPPITNGIFSSPIAKYIYIAFGVIFVGFGAKLIVDATSESMILENALLGKLVTTGIYSKTRNPMYGGIIFICTGIIFMSGNAFMFVVPVILWGVLTLIMIKTEEPMLIENFGDAYKEYMDKTYRFLPSPKK